MSKMLVKELHPYDTPSVMSEDADLRDIVQHFVENPFDHHVCIVDASNHLLGLVNRKRLFKNLFSHHISSDSRVSKLFTYHTARTSSQLMLTHIFSATEEETIDYVIKVLIEHNIRELPILDRDGRLLGILTTLRLMQEWLAGNIA
jgi:CBS-domain-containing membrane protein